VGLPSAYPEGEVIGVGIPTNRGELARVRRELGCKGGIIVPEARGGISPHELELLMSAGRLTPGDLAMVKDIIALAARTDLAPSGEQIAAVIERAQSQRAGAAALH
jgi:hypothetical protein